MRVAIIAPPSLSHLNTATGYTLALPHLFQRQKYLEEIKNSSAYKILDNGAAENYETEPQDLHDIADEVDANEIVIPDMIGKGRATSKMALDFRRYVKDKFKYMAVAQGETWADLYACIDALAGMPWVSVLGVPRDIYKFDKLARIETVKHILRSYPSRFQIHCLGSTPWLRELVLLKNTVQVRGIDTSAPVYMGYGRNLITGSSPSNYKSRPKGYFGFGKPSEYQARLITANCRIYYSWANPQASTSDLREVFPEYSRDEVLSEQRTGEGKAGGSR